MDSSSELKPISLEEWTVRFIEFEKQLKKVAGRYKPAHFLKECALRFRLGSADKEFSHFGRPDYMAWAIESVCAYYAPHKFVPFDSHGYRAVIDLHHKFCHDYMARIYAHDHSIFDAMSFAFRTQMLLQMPLSRHDLGRWIRILSSLDPNGPAAVAFRTQYGVQIHNWPKLLIVMACAFGALGVEENRFVTAINNGYVRHLPRMGIPDTDVNDFLTLASYSIDDIREEYKRRRSPEADTPLPFVRHMMPMLLERPLFRFDDLWCCIAPNALRTLAGYRLIELLKLLRHEEARAEICAAFEHYVEDVLLRVPGRLAVANESTLRCSDSKSCDYLFEFENAIVLVESKFIHLKSNIVTPTAIISQQASKEVLEARIQLATTARKISEGELQLSRPLGGRPILPIIAIAGDFPLVNTIEFMELAKKHRGDLVREYDSIIDGLTAIHSPQCFPAEAIDFLATACLLANRSIRSLWDERTSGHPMIVGDWTKFLQDICADRDARSSMAYWIDPALDMMNEMKSLYDKGE